MHSWRWKVFASVMLAVLAFGIYRASVYFTNDQLDAVRIEQDFRQCQRGNLVRGYLRQDARRNAKDPEIRGALADKLFPILDCRLTVSTGENVPLRPFQQAAYLRGLGE